MVANSGLYKSGTAKQEESAELRAFLINVTGMKHPDCLKTKRRYLDFNFNSSLQKKKGCWGSQWNCFRPGCLTFGIKRCIAFDTHPHAQSNPSRWPCLSLPAVAMVCSEEQLPRERQHGNGVHTASVQVSSRIMSRGLGILKAKRPSLL